MAAALLSVILGFVSVMMLAEAKNAEGIALLRQMKQQAIRLHTIDAHDATLAKIAFSGARGQLILSKEQFDAILTAFNPLAMLFPQSKDVRGSEILQSKLTDFFEHAERFFAQSQDQRSTQQFEATFEHLMEHLHAMSDNAAIQEYHISKMRQAILYALFVLSLLLLLFIRQKQRLINIDLQFLYGVKTPGYQIRTQEVESIAANIKHSSVEKEQQTQMDPIAQIKNYKGLIQAFNNSKTLQRNNALCVCVFEIDHHTDLEKLYKKPFIEGIVRKIASMLSPYEGFHEIVGVMDESKFIFILSRSSKQEALKECEVFKESVAEAHFKTPEGVPIKITLSGGLVQKVPNKSIDTVIQYAAEVLKKAQENGINRIAQIRENAEKL